MNKAFRTIWNEARQCFMAVAEFARGKCGGGSGNAVTRAVSAALFALIGTAYAPYALATTCPASPVGDTDLVVDQSCAAFNWNGTSGSINVTSSGSIVGAGAAITLPNATISGGITNSGLIVETVGGTTAGAVRLRTNSLIQGGLLNSGLIQSQTYGIQVDGGSRLTGGVVNSATGSIYGGFVGIGLWGGSLAGGVLNRGSLSGAAAGLFLGGAAGAMLEGAVINHGLIGAAGKGIVLNAGARINGGFENYGVVSGNETAIYISQSSTVFGDILNSGMITSSGTGNRAVLITSNSFLSGSIVNAGTISATGHGIELNGGSTITGDITNAGLISASLTGWGDNSGVAIQGALLSGSLLNQSTGTITGANFGLLADGGRIAGGVHNYGAIIGGNAGIQVETDALISGVINHNYISSINVQSGTIAAGTAIIGMVGSTIAEGITNTGLVAGTNGTAINHQGAQTTVSNSGTIIGGITGNLDVTNSGLWALQTWSGGTTVAGSLAFAYVAGNYYQASSGTLSVGVNDRGTAGYGTTSGNYSSLTVGGAATFGTNSNVYVSMNGETAVADGGTLAGVVTATSLSSSGFTIRDNSGLVNFTAATSATTLDLVAVTQVGCGATVTGSETGPCEVAFDTPNLYVANTGSISGAAQGVSVLPVNACEIYVRMLKEFYIG